MVVFYTDTQQTHSVTASSSIVSMYNTCMFRRRPLTAGASLYFNNNSVRVLSYLSFAQPPCTSLSVLILSEKSTVRWIAIKIAIGIYGSHRMNHDCSLAFHQAPSQCLVVLCKLWILTTWWTAGVTTWEYVFQGGFWCACAGELLKSNGRVKKTYNVEVSV